MDSPYVSPYTLECNFVKCFAPIHLQQLLIGTIRVNIQKQSVTYNTINQKIYRLIFVFLAIFVLYDFCWNLYEAFEDYPIILSNLFGNVLILSITFACNIVNISFFNQTDNVTVYHTLQKVDNFLQLGSVLDTAQYYWHLFFIYMTFFGTTISEMLFFYSLLGYLPISTMCGLITTEILYIYFEMVALAALIFYLTKRLRVLKAMFLIRISREMNQFHEPLDSEYVLLDKRLLHIVHRISNRKLVDYVICFNNICTAFNTIGDLYKLQVICCTKCKRKIQND